MAKKKDLQGAITKGADLFFSANDQQAVEADVEQEAQETQEALEQDAQEVSQAQTAVYAEQPQKVQEAERTIQPYKAQDVTPEALAASIADMQDKIEAKIEAAEARRTQGRKGFKMQRINITITPSGLEYVKIMAGISGKSVTQYINDIIAKEAAANAELYQKARELMEDAR